VVAIAAAVTGVAFMLAIERQTADTLYVYRVAPAERPRVDGESSEAIWQKIPPVSVVTERGGNFSGTGETTVSIQAVHDGTYAYFLFIWNDPTRSLKQLPSRKSPKGWELLHDGYEYGDERSFNEDKFAVLLTSLDSAITGDLTFHAGTEPAAGKPKTLSAGISDQHHAAPVAEGSRQTTAALSHFDLDPNHGESEGARWYMTEEGSLPYSADLDRQIPERTIVPGVIISGNYSGDRADARCGVNLLARAAQWFMPTVEDSPSLSMSGWADQYSERKTAVSG
jgi:hypothetical protein